MLLVMLTYHILITHRLDNLHLTHGQSFLKVRYNSDSVSIKGSENENTDLYTDLKSLKNVTRCTMPSRGCRLRFFCTLHAYDS